MKIRSFLALTALAVILAACATAAPDNAPSDAPTSSPPPSAAPSVAPSVAPPEPAEPEVIGTVTILPAAVDGPGLSLAEALSGDLSEPIFIRGFVFKDTDGQVYFADEMTDESAPTFSSPRVLVANHPTDGPTWDIGHAGVTGLQEANGVLFYEDAAIYGTFTE